MAKSKLQAKCLKEFFFADDVAISPHSAEEPQQLMHRSSKAWSNFGLYQPEKTKAMGQDVESSAGIRISEHERAVVHDFNDLSLPLSLLRVNKRIVKAATPVSRLTRRLWSNSKLTQQPKIHVYRVCVMSTSLYGSESQNLTGSSVTDTCAASDTL